MSNPRHDTLEAGEVRRRVRLRIEALKHEASQHRIHVDAATAAYGPWLEQVAVPLFRQFTQALRAEGLLFRVNTPTGLVRIEAERSADDYLELSLDTERRPPAVVLRRGYTRGHHVFTDERVVAEGIDYSHVSPSDVLDHLVEDATPFLSR
jgi:hypothetical protein